ASTLHLDVHKARKRLQRPREQRDALAAEPRGLAGACVARAHDGVRRIGEERTETGRPGERLVVDDHDLAGSAPLRVELYSVSTLRERERERGQGVLRR